MANYDLNDYFTDTNAVWYKYNLTGGFIPICVIRIPFEYSSSDHYVFNKTITVTAPFNFPTCMDFIQTGTQTVIYQKQIYTNTSDRYFHFERVITNGAITGTLKITMYNPDGTVFRTMSAGSPYTTGDRIIGYCFLFYVLQFSNNVNIFLGNSFPNSENVSEPIPLTQANKGKIELNSYTVTFNSSQYLPQYNSTSQINTINRIMGSSTFYDPGNPYNGGDASENPGDGQFDYGGDDIDIPDLPSVSVTDSGFVSLFAPTNAQLQELGNYLWSDAFSIESFKKMFNNPMDCILGLSIVPVNLPTGSAKEITVGNVVSTVKCNVCTNQYVKVDCGTFSVSPTRFTGSYLDYSPYTKCFVYLPFIGIQQLNIDDVMNSTIHCVYHVDILTGACVCFLKMTNRISGGAHANDATLYSFSGQCAESVPLSATSFSNTMGSILTAAGAIGGAVATIASGGAAAPVAGALTTAATSTANVATSMKPNVQHSGSLGGSSGFMGIRYPFMIFDAPHTAIPSRQYLYTGYPSNSVTKIKNLSGFNVIQAVNLEVKGALDTECDMIKSLLLSGVII